MTGYRGRTGIYELIEIGEALREAIHDGQGEQSLLRLPENRAPVSMPMVADALSAVRPASRKCCG